MLNKGTSIGKILKNNSLKISAISVFLIMLISIVFIFPIKEEKDTVSDGNIDFTIVYDAANNVFYKNSVGGTVITPEELAVLKISGSKDGTTGVSTITLNGTNIVSTAAIALNIVGDATINVVDGTENYINKTSKKLDAHSCNIFSNGNITFKGNGILNLELLELTKESEDWDWYEAIRVYKKVNIKEGNLNIYMMDIYDPKACLVGVVATGVTVSESAEFNFETTGTFSQVEAISSWQDIEVLGKVNVNFHDVIGSEEYGVLLEGMSADANVTIGAENKSVGSYDLHIKNCEELSATGIHTFDTNIKILGGNVGIYIRDNEDVSSIKGFYSFNPITINESNIHMDIINNASTYERAQHMGIWSNSNKVSIKNSNVEIYNNTDKDSTATECGLVCSTLDVSGGNILVRAKDKAIETTALTLDQTKADEFAPITDVYMASTNIDGSGYEDYNVNNLSTYKYVLIDEVYDYSLEYNATDGSLLKVVRTKTTDETTGETVTNKQTTNIEKENLLGWDTKLLDDGTHALMLNGFDFATTASTAMEFQSEYESVVIELADSTTNRVYVKSEGENEIFGIDAYNVSLTIQSSGSLDMKLASGNSNSTIMTAIYADVLNVENANISIDMYDKKLDNAQFVENSFIGTYTGININNAKICLKGYYIEGNVPIVGYIGSEEGDVQIDNSKIDFMSNNIAYDMGITGNNIIFNKSDTKMKNNMMSISELKNKIIDSGAIPEEDIDVVMDELSMYYRNSLFFNEQLSVNGGSVAIDYTGDISDVFGINAYESGTIAFNDTQVEINAGTAINNVPTFTNCSIVKAKTKTDETEIMPGVPGDVASYRYVLIHQNYYLNFDTGTGEMTINGTSTPTLVDGWSPVWDSTNNVYKLVLDGFEFSTSNKFGIRIIGNGIVESVKNSINTITLNCTSTENTGVINARSNLTIQGEGLLNINNYYSKSSGNGIYSAGDAIINNAVLRFKANVGTYYGINANTSFRIENSKIDFADIKTSGYQTCLLYANQNGEIKSSNIKTKLISTYQATKQDDLNCVIYAKNGDVTIDDTDMNTYVEIDSIQVINAVNKNININNSNIYINGKSTFIYGIKSVKSGEGVGQLNITGDSTIYIDVESEMATQEGYFSRIYGLHAKGMNIEDADITVKANGKFKLYYGIHADFKGLTMERTNVAMYADIKEEDGEVDAYMSYEGDVSIKDSTFNIQFDAKNSSGFTVTNDGSIKFDNTKINYTCNSVNGSTYGIVTTPGDIELINDTTINADINTAEKKYDSYGNILEEKLINTILGKITISDAHIEVTGKMYYMKVIVSNKGDIDIKDNTEINIDVETDNLMITDMEMYYQYTDEYIEYMEQTIEKQFEEYEEYIEQLPDEEKETMIQQIESQKLYYESMFAEMRAEQEEYIQEFKGNVNIENATITSTVISRSNDADVDNIRGICNSDSSGNINITGDSTVIDLDLRSNTDTVQGIYAEKGNINISNGASIIMNLEAPTVYNIKTNNDIVISNSEITSTNKSTENYGIYSYGGNITATSSTINATETTANASAALMTDQDELTQEQLDGGAKYAGTIAVTNCKINVVANSNLSAERAYGIYAKKGKIKVEGANTDIDIQLASLSSAGIYSKGNASEISGNIDIILTNEITNASTDSDGAGIVSRDDLKVSDANILIKGTSDRFCGIDSEDGNLIIDESNIELKDIAGEFVYGICTDPDEDAPSTSIGDITITGTSIDADYASYSGVLYNIYASKGDVYIKKDDDSEKNNNISVNSKILSSINIYTGQGSVNITNGYMELIFSDLAGESALISATGDVSVKNANMKLIGSGAFVAGIVSARGKIDIDESTVDIDIKRYYLALGIGTQNNTNTGDDVGNINITASNVDINIYNEAQGMTAEGISAIYGDVNIVKDNDSTRRNSINISVLNNIDAFALKSEYGEVKVSNSDMVLQGNTKAVSGSMELDTATDPNIGVLAASRNYDGSNIEGYESGVDYKYMVIGQIENYAYRYYPTAGKLYAYDSDTGQDIELDTAEEWANIGVSIINDETANILKLNSLNMTSTKDVALWIIGDAYIEVGQGTENNIFTTTSAESESVADRYGIKGTGDIYLSGQGTINLNKTSASDNDENYYGIYSINDVIISEEKVNLTEDKMKILVSNAATKGNTYGVYGTNVNFAYANASVEVSDNNSTSYGVFADDTRGGILVNDGEVEIKADKVTNVVPTYTNVGITGATNSNGSNVWPGVVDNTPSYKYVLIQPNYYLNYNASNGKLYRSNTGTEANIAGWRTDTSTGTNVLVIDGLNFETTAQYGISFSGGNTLTIADGSENRIFINHFVVEAVNGIYSKGAGKISGSGELTININNSIAGAQNRAQYVKGIVYEGKIEIYDSKLNIDVISNNYKAANIYSNSSIYISGTELDLKAKSPGLNYSIYAYSETSGHVEIKDSIITCRIEGPEANAAVKGLQTGKLENVQLVVDSIGQGCHYGFSSSNQGYIKNSTLRLKNDGGHTHMVHNGMDGLTIDNSDIYLDLDIEESNSIGIISYSSLNIINSSYIEYNTNSVNPVGFKCGDESCKEDHFIPSNVIICYGNANFRDSELKVDAVTTRLDILLAYGELTIDNSYCDVKMEQANVDLDSTEVIESGGFTGLAGDLNIINKSTIKLDASFEKMFPFYSGSTMNIDDATLEMKGTSDKVFAMESWGGNIIIDESTIDMSDMISDEFYGVTTSQDELTDAAIANGATYEGDITITGSKVNIDAQKMGVESHGEAIKSQYGNILIDKDSDSEKINDIDINLDMKENFAIHAHGDTTINNGQIDITTTSSEVDSTVHGISGGAGVTILGDETLINMNLSSVKESVGTDSSKGNVSILNGAEVNINAKADTTAKGIWTDKDDASVNVTSSAVEIYVGKNTADAIAVDTQNLTLGQTKEYSSEILEASTTYKDIAAGESYEAGQIISFPGANKTEYKYVKIANAPAYGYSFNVDNGRLSKVYSDNTSEELDVLPSGCSVYTNGQNQYVLKLHNFEFQTIAPVVLEVKSGSANTSAIGNVEFSGENNIRLIEGINTIYDEDKDGTDDENRFGLYVQNMNTCNLIGDGNLKLVTHGYAGKDIVTINSGILSKADLNMSFGKYDTVEEVNVGNLILGIQCENAVNINGTDINVDLNYCQGGSVVEVVEDMTITGAKIKLADSDRSNTENKGMIMGITCAGNMYVQESSTISLAVESAFLGIGISVANDLQILSSTVQVDLIKIADTYMTGGIIANKLESNAANVNCTLVPISNTQAMVIGITSENFKDIGSTYNIIMEDNSVNNQMAGINISNEWDITEENPNYKLVDMQGTNMTIDIKSNEVRSYAMGLSLNGKIVKMENETSFVQELAGECVINGGSMDINCKSGVSDAFVGKVDNVTISNMDKLDIHAYNNISQAEFDEGLNGLRASFEDERDNGELTAEEIAIEENWCDKRGHALVVENLVMYNSNGRLSSNINNAIEVIDSCDTKGEVKSSQTYAALDTEPSDIATVTDLDTDYDKYKYVKISPSIITVDISWGGLNYKYNYGTWNTSTAVYDGREWQVVDDEGNQSANGDRISINNRSNVPINASVIYNSKPEYESDITGKIVTDKASDTLLMSPSQILVNDTLDTYLKLEGEPSGYIDNGVIGDVTVTLAE